MQPVWWRPHLRQLPDLTGLKAFAAYAPVDDVMPYLVDRLDLPAGGAVLDLGCGTGSFAIRLAQWGYRVVAVEEAEPMLAGAREEAERWQVEPEFRCQARTALRDRSAYDGVLMLDFGTMSDADNAQALRSVAAALRPGGRVVFSTCNPYYWSREPRTEHRTTDGLDIVRRYVFDFDAGTVRSRVRLIHADGARRDLPDARYRAYTIPELRALTAAVGLADLAICGEDEDGLPQPDEPLATLTTQFFHCVALRPVIGEGGEGI